jgi:tetratricopeptide (TPR) repeat protein
MIVNTMEDLLPVPTNILASIQIDPKSIRSIRVPLQRSTYQAVVNWLTRYCPSSDSSNLEKITGLLETFHHLCELGAWEKASRLLRIRLVTPTQEELDNQLHTWGYYTEQIQLYQRLLGQIDEEWDALILNGLGIAFNSHGKYQEAMLYHEKQLEIALKIESQAIRARAFGGLGIAHHCLGEYSTAVSLYTEQLRLAQALGNLSMMLNAVGGLGLCQYKLGNYSEALQRFELQRELNQEQNDPVVEGRLQNNLGNIYLAQGKLQEALEAYQTWLDTAHRIGDRAG